jgi:hypothetical protein
MRSSIPIRIPPAGQWPASEGGRNLPRFAWVRIHNRGQADVIMSTTHVPVNDPLDYDDYIAAGSRRVRNFSQTSVLTDDKSKVLSAGELPHELHFVNLSATLPAVLLVEIDDTPIVDLGTQDPTGIPGSLMYMQSAAGAWVPVGYGASGLGLGVPVTILGGATFTPGGALTEIPFADGVTRFTPANGVFMAWPTLPLANVGKKAISLVVTTAVLNTGQCTLRPFASRSAYAGGSGATSPLGPGQNYLGPAVNFGPAGGGLVLGAMFWFSWVLIAELAAAQAFLGVELNMPAITAGAITANCEPWSGS